MDSTHPDKIDSLVADQSTDKGPSPKDGRLERPLRVESQEGDVLDILDAKISMQKREINRLGEFPKVSEAVKEEGRRFAAFTDWKEYKHMETKKHDDLLKYMESVEGTASQIQNQRERWIEDFRAKVFFGKTHILP